MNTFSKKAAFASIMTIFISSNDLMASDLSHDPFEVFPAVEMTHCNGCNDQFVTEVYQEGEGTFKRTLEQAHRCSSLIYREKKSLSFSQENDNPVMGLLSPSLDDISLSSKETNLSFEDVNYFEDITQEFKGSAFTGYLLRNYFSKPLSFEVKTPETLSFEPHSFETEIPEFVLPELRDSDIETLDIQIIPAELVPSEDTK